MPEEGDPSPADAGVGSPPATELAWETLDSWIDYTCPGFDVRADRVRFPDGTEGEFHTLTEPESVVVLPFTGGGGRAGEDPSGDDELVVVAEWRQAVGRVNYGLPAGGREPGDADLAETALRELTEETGYVAETVEPLVTTEPVNGAADTVHNYFVARDCAPDGEQDLDDNESIRVETTTFSDLIGRVLAGEVRDGRTVLGALFYDRIRAE